MSRSDRFETYQLESGRWEAVSVDNPRSPRRAQGATEVEALLAMLDEVMEALDDVQSRVLWD